MQSNVVIQVNQLSKQYDLQKKPSQTIAELFRFGKSKKNISNTEIQLFWALKGICFEVKKGEVIGVIGKNGAGKSTLLKILSKITAPTLGTVKIKGKIGSLLEVGTGFHPELSGRENIFLNGAILGMRRQEIKAKLDEIISFAGVEAFADEPVKHYSSGMYTRLAFAVAAHLETDILIVDEVLAVGDFEFQKKCLSKMQEVSTQEGKTVLFVSHQMQAIKSLTEKCLLLSAGEIIYQGETQSAINFYLENQVQSDLIYEDSENLNQTKIIKVQLSTTYKNNVQESGDSLTIELSVFAKEIIKKARFGIEIINENLEKIIFLNFDDIEDKLNCDLTMGMNIMVCKIPNLRLYKGKYHLSIHFAEFKGGRKFQYLEGLCPFEVQLNLLKERNNWKFVDCKYFENVSWQFNQFPAYKYIHGKGYTA